MSDHPDSVVDRVKAFGGGRSLLYPASLIANFSTVSRQNAP
jgi:hypothetical protein